MHQARVEAAERTSVVVDLRDAEVARLELLNEALDPLFADVPADIELFDRGLSRGDTPRLWIDPVAHVAMGRDKRSYRFLLDNRFGRRVLAEFARNSRHRQSRHRLCGAPAGRARARARRRSGFDHPQSAAPKRRAARRRRRNLGALLLGFVLGVVTLAVAAFVFATALS